jgi:hypothetical protein
MDHGKLKLPNLTKVKARSISSTQERLATLYAHVAQALTPIFTATTQTLDLVSTGAVPLAP